MIEFMVIALPRSGTTWAANWLTTDTTLCFHDPLFNRHYSELDSIISNKKLGISCTGLYMFPDFLNNHPARKVILHRDLNEINTSLSELGFNSLSIHDEEKLCGIDGIHINYSELFNNPEFMYEYLLEKKFDKERHKELSCIEMQPQFSRLTINKNVAATLMKELRGI